MTQRIIAGYVDTPGGRDALALAVALADLSPDTELTVARVYLYNPPVETAPPSGWRKALRETAEGELAWARERYGTRERTSFTAACGVSPADGLHRLADELGAQAIVTGMSHRKGAGRILDGSVTEQTLRGAPCAVAIAPVGYAEGAPHPARTIAVAVNGSDESSRALEVAGRIARKSGAPLRILGVVEQSAVWYSGYMGPGAAGDVREFVREDLERARTRVTGVDDVRVEILEGEPSRALGQAAADAGLLVLGSRGHGPLRRVILGSVSARLVREPPCPLLVLPRGAAHVPGEDEDEAAAGPASEAIPGT
jgi:nucleotide-binding universal stress UspA family protein